jgi:O-antigen/teichoic acid export membrane protein
MLALSILSQAVSFIATPIVARIYGPASYGAAQSFLYFFQFASPLVCLSLPLGILSARTDRLAYVVARLSMLTALAFSALIAVILLQAYLLGYLHVDPILLLISPFAILLEGFYQIVQQLITRARLFYLSGMSILASNVISAGFKIGLGHLSADPITLVISTLLLIPANLATLAIFARKQMTGHHSLSAALYRSKFNFQDLRRAAFIYRTVPMMRLPGGFVFMAHGALPGLIIAYADGAREVGYFAAAAGLINAPTGILRRILSDVVLQFIRTSPAGSDLGRMIMRITLLLTAAGIIPLIAAFVIAPKLIEVLFGHQFIPTADYFQALILPGFATVVIAPTLSLLALRRQEKLLLFFELISLAFKVLAFFVLVHVGINSRSAMMMVSVALTVAIVCFGIFVHFAKVKQAALGVGTRLGGLGGSNEPTQS